MASRRSRLQIKPNIGGPKLPGAKPGAKTSDPKSLKGENSAAPARSTSPRKSVNSSHGGSTQKSSESPKKNFGVISSLAPKLNKSPRKSVDTSEKEVKINEKTENENDTDQTGSNKDPRNSSPSASINRFTKLTPKGVKNETLKNSITETVAQESNIDEMKQAHTESYSISEKMEKHNDVNLKEEQQLNMAKSTTLPRRSRFPKAKPNVIDASKKRQRNSIVPDSRSPAKTSNISTEQKESPLKRKAPNEVKIINEYDIITEKTVEVVDGRLVAEQEAPGTPQPFIPPKSPVKNPSANFNHVRLPVKAPVQTFSPLASPAKDAHGATGSRARTLSTSEAPVIKKPRRTKIDIPTDKPPDRATMKMRDLIHWNPSSNPMKVKEKPEVKINTVGEEKENKKAKDKAKTNETQNKTAENTKDKDTTGETVDADDDVDTAMPVPQVTIGPDGNIVINEKSLVVENENLETSISQDDEIIDETDHMTTYGSFRTHKSFKRWTKKETTKFYKALAMIGADFFLIQKVFPKRSRDEIKRKFKKEEKQNSKLVEMVLKEGIHFDRSFIENDGNEESSDEEVAKVQPKEKKKEKAKVVKVELTDKPTVEKEKKRKGRKPKSQTKQVSAIASLYDKGSDEETEVVEDNVPILHNKDDVDWEPPPNITSTSNNSVKFREPLERRAKHAALNPDVLFATPVSLESQPEPKVIKLPIINPLAKANYIPDHNTSEPELDPNVSYTTSTVSGSVELHNSSRYSNEISHSIDSSNVEYLGVPMLTETNTIPAIHNSSISQNSSMHSSPRVQSSLILNLSENHPFKEASPTESSSQAVPMMTEVNNSAVSNNVPLTISPQDMMQFQMGSDSADQYVLVTVVPEGSEETVIHIYKVPASAGSVQFSTDT